MRSEPICPLCGFFEVYTESGRFLGMFFRLLDAFEWVKTQPLGARFRMIHRGPDMFHEGLFPTLRIWVSPLPGGKVKSEPVMAFAEGGAQ